MYIRLILLLILFTLAACGSDDQEAGTNAPTANAPVTVETTAATPADDTVAYGRNEDGTFFYGAPDAPVTLTDYSDFL